jgi:hypothetical protein
MMVERLCPEVELLLCCARTQLNSENAARIKALLREDIDWELVLQKGLQHGIVPLLYSHLQTTAPHMVSPLVLEQFKNLFDANTRRNLFLTGELIRLLDFFASHGISAIPFKGPALAAAVYGNVALRQFGDLDIFVPKRHVRRAADLLVALGFRPKFELVAAKEQTYLDSQYELVFTRDDGKIIVELHWEIVPHYFAAAFTLDDVWERIDRMPKDSLGFPTLPAEETFLALCIHGTKHLWERLAWICDLAETARVYEGLDWKWLIEESRKLGTERMLHLGIFLASDLLGMVVPKEVQQSLAVDLSVKKLAAQVRQRLFQKNNYPIGVMETCRFHLRTRERLQHRTRYCLRLATTTTPGDWAALSLPAPLFPLYFLLRPLRLARKYGLASARRAYEKIRQQGAKSKEQGARDSKAQFVQFADGDKKALSSKVSAI